MNIYEKVKRVWNENRKEFEDRTGEWAKNLETNSVKGNRLKFRAWKPLGVYVSYTSAKKGEFSIRYCGQEVGKLRMMDGHKYLVIDEKTKEHNKGYFCFKDCEVGKHRWEEEVAKEFRKHFKNLHTKGNKVKPGIGEHKLESLFLQEMSKRKDKFSGKFSQIQPIKIGGCPFQMPLPIKGSNGEPKKGDGHTDILARRRREDNRRKVVISIWELKDFNKLAEAVKQVYIYSITLLLMLQTHSGQAWYKIFGFGKELPRKLELDAVVAVDKNLRGKLLKEFETVKDQMPLEVEEGSVRLYVCFYDLTNQLGIDFERIA